MRILARRLLKTATLRGQFQDLVLHPVKSLLKKKLLPAEQTETAEAGGTTAPAPAVPDIVP